MSRIAIIDMGTNTFHLLIAEVNDKQTPRIIYRDLQAVKIGMGGINEGRITNEARQRAIMAMQRFRDAMAPFGVSEIRAFGTSAFRSAHNAPEIVQAIVTATGIPVTIISGDREADLIFRGARAAITMNANPHLVMDIGAGSVEFIIGDAHGIRWKKSFEIGGQRLLERFHKHDPILPEEIESLDACFDEHLAPLLLALEQFNPKILVGVSGTFDTLSQIFCIKQGIPWNDGSSETPLSVGGFYEIYQELIHKNRNQRMDIKGMIELRVDMIVVTSCLIRWILEQHKIERITVSSWSLKEGALALMVEETHHD